jgi:hypothetical protein
MSTTIHRRIVECIQYGNDPVKPEDCKIIPDSSVPTISGAPSLSSTTTSGVSSPVSSSTPIEQLTGALKIIGNYFQPTTTKFSISTIGKFLEQLKTLQPLLKNDSSLDHIDIQELITYLEELKTTANSENKDSIDDPIERDKIVTDLNYNIKPTIKSLLRKIQRLNPPPPPPPSSPSPTITRWEYTPQIYGLISDKSYAGIYNALRNHYKNEYLKGDSSFQTLFETFLRQEAVYWRALNTTYKTPKEEQEERFSTRDAADKTWYTIYPDYRRPPTPSIARIHSNSRVLQEQIPEFLLKNYTSNVKYKEFDYLQREWLYDFINKEIAWFESIKNKLDTDTQTKAKGLADEAWKKLYPDWKPLLTINPLQIKRTRRGGRRGANKKTLKNRISRLH